MLRLDPFLSMNIARCSFSVALIGLAIAATSRLSAQAPEAVPLDQRDMQAAGKLLIEGKYADALKFYEGVPQKYPSSLYIPEANLRTAICYYFLKNYDK